MSAAAVAGAASKTLQSMAHFMSTLAGGSTLGEIAIRPEDIKKLQAAPKKPTISKARGSANSPITLGKASLSVSVNFNPSY
jgi:hypothetical protein